VKVFFDEHHSQAAIVKELGIRISAQIEALQGCVGNIKKPHFLTRFSDQLHSWRSVSITPQSLFYLAYGIKSICGAFLLAEIDKLEHHSL
jgi:hypothetical protein